MAIKKQLTLKDAIYQFFIDNHFGTRDELIKHLNSLINDPVTELVNKFDKVVSEIARTTIYGYLDSGDYASISFKDESTKGRPQTYFLLASEKEEILKSLEDKFEIKADLALRIIDFAKANNNSFTKDEIIKEFNLDYNKFRLMTAYLEQAGLINPSKRRVSYYTLKEDVDNLKQKLINNKKLLPVSLIKLKEDS